MTKRIFLLFICCTLMLLSAAALSGCGKEKDDLVQQGLTSVSYTHLTLPTICSV